MIMKNMPELKIGVVAVSRDCFPEELICEQKRSIDKGLQGEVRRCGYL